VGDGLAVGQRPRVGELSAEVAQGADRGGTPVAPTRADNTGHRKARCSVGLSNVELRPARTRLPKAFAAQSLWVGRHLK
jgi:hypothetical protein